MVWPAVLTWEALRALSGGNVHVVGVASTEGAAMIRFLVAQGFACLTVHDFQPADEVARTFRRMHVGLRPDARDEIWRALAEANLRRCFGHRYLEGIEEADAVFVGQAWRLYAANRPRLVDMHGRGVPFHTIAELYFGLSPAPIAAVTGSNGKSTTSRLLEAILKRSPRSVYYAGNERHSVQVLDRLAQMEQQDILVLEISNRQLVDVEPRPHIGVITTVQPNHLDEHGGSFSEYANVKRRLVAYQREGDFAVLNADDPVCREIGRGLEGSVYWFSRAGPVQRGAWLVDGTLRLRDSGREALIPGRAHWSAGLRGAHGEANALAACLAAWLGGADAEAIEAGLTGFRGLRHRIQFVWRLDGVDYYDDLAATTPQASLAALEVLTPPVVLIAGGDDKGLDFGPLAEAVAARVRRLVLLPGAGSDRLAAAVRAHAGGTSTAIDRFTTLTEAVEDVVATAAAGDTVLLSPACPFFFSRHYLAADAAEVGFRSLLRRITCARREGR